MLNHNHNQIQSMGATNPAQLAQPVAFENAATKAPLLTNSIPVSSTDQEEANALENLTEELGLKLFERLRESYSGQFITIHIEPSFQNLGAVAQIRIMSIGAPKTVVLFSSRLDSLPLLDENAFKATVLGPAIKCGRAGSAPQTIPLRLMSGEEQITGVMTLFVGIRRR